MTDLSKLLNLGDIVFPWKIYLTKVLPKLRGKYFQQFFWSISFRKESTVVIVCTFLWQSEYEASVPEHSPAGTLITTVHAEDADAGQLGVVRYSVAGGGAAGVSVDPVSGQVTVADPRLLDREERRELTVTVTATDNADEGSVRSATVPVS